MEYTCPNAKIQFFSEHSAISTQPSVKQMFPQNAFVKMYYFAIEARDGVGYTLAALRCEVRDL